MIERGKELTVRGEPLAHYYSPVSPYFYTGEGLEYGCNSDAFEMPLHVSRQTVVPSSGRFSAAAALMLANQVPR